MTPTRTKHRRGGPIVPITDTKGAQPYAGLHAPSAGAPCDLLVFAPAIQLLAYHVGVLKGLDVDQPRNLAKSVTVE